MGKNSIDSWMAQGERQVVSPKYRNSHLTDRQEDTYDSSPIKGPI
jgi:hypothetical protein